jgi:glycerophosphoryl diester phosphodiesterase
MTVPFAHRGLHGPGVPENSRAAFRAAIERGHGIELDVQASAEGEAMVFHDYDLGRLTEVSGALAARLRPDLQKVRLKENGEILPTLAEILALIRGKVPLLIEVKARARADVEPLCFSVARSLEGYRGPVGVMSFNPRVGYWFDRHAPSVVRGLVVTEEGKGWRGPIERRLALLWARPEFLAYDVRDLPSRFAAIQRARGLPVFTWTCRTPANRASAAAYADQPIYEEA